MLRITINQINTGDLNSFVLSFLWNLFLGSKFVNVGTDFRICINNECLKIDSNTLIRHFGPLLIAFFASMPGAPTVRQDKYNITVSEQR